MREGDTITERDLETLNQLAIIEAKRPLPNLERALPSIALLSVGLAVLGLYLRHISSRAQRIYSRIGEDNEQRVYG